MAYAKATLHKDGTASYGDIDHAITLTREQLDAIPIREARRIALHLASRGDEVAREWMDAYRGRARKSDWYSTPSDLRNRRHVSLTLSDEARARLASIAKNKGTTRSQVVEEWIMSQAIGPWYITDTAVRQYATLRGADRADAIEELRSIAKDAAERKSPRRTAGGLLCYRVRKPIDVQLLVSDSARDEGTLPQLVAVVAGFRK